MFVSHRDEIERRRLSSSALNGVTKQVLIGPDQGWEDYVMRMFTLDVGGYTPKHCHAWSHVIYSVEGDGMLIIDGKECQVRAGSTAYVDGGLEHQVLNTGDTSFVFICIVPREGDV